MDDFPVLSLRQSEEVDCVAAGPHVLLVVMSGICVQQTLWACVIFVVMCRVAGTACCGVWYFVHQAVLASVFDVV